MASHTETGSGRDGPAGSGEPRAVERLATERLTLEPLTVEHAEEMAPLLDDAALHRYIGGRPATFEELRARYRRQVTGSSPDGSERWFNWVVRSRGTGEAVGTVQASVSTREEHAVAEVAWVIATAFQRRGYAREAAAAMLRWLEQQGVQRVVAHVHPDHRASAEVARAVGLDPTGIVVDGEIRWQRAQRST